MKRLFLFGSLGALLTSGLIFAGLLDLEMAKQEQTTSQAEEQAADGNAGKTAQAGPLQLSLQRTYLCGGKTEEEIQTEQTMEQVLAEHSGWEIVSVEADRLVLHKAVNDIAPSCKENGYFGLSAEGILTLFNGLPSEQKVVQTFYPLDMEKMENSLPKAEVDLLKQGIRVRDLAEYNSVLSTYDDFQVDTAAEAGH